MHFHQTKCLIVCYYHITYAFWSESTLYSCLNIKELLAWDRRDIGSLSDCNGIRTNNHLVRKRELKHLAKLAIWLNGWVFVSEVSGCGFESRYSHLKCLMIMKFGNRKDGFHSISKIFLKGRLLWWVDWKVKFLQDISFDNGFHKIVLSSLLLFSCAFYKVDLGNIQWKQVTTSTTRNFDNNWPLYLNFSNMINLCPNIWFKKIQNVRKFYF